MQMQPSLIQKEAFKKSEIAPKHTINQVSSVEVFLQEELFKDEI